MDSEHPSLSQLIAIHMMHINSNSSGTCIGLMLGMHLCFGDGSKLGKENDLPSKMPSWIWCYKQSSESNAITLLSRENIDGIVTQSVSTCRMEATTYIDCFPPPAVQPEYCKMCAMTLRWRLVLPKLGIKRECFTLKWPCLCNSNMKNILLYQEEAGSVAWLFSTMFGQGVHGVHMRMAVIYELFE